MIHNQSELPPQAAGSTGHYVADHASYYHNIDYMGTTVSSENNFVDGLENTGPGPTGSNMLLIKNYGQPNYSRPNSRSEHRR